MAPSADKDSGKSSAHNPPPVINSHTNNVNGAFTLLGSILNDSIFKVIPVLDLLNGVVVCAKKGDRANYQAIQSQLTQSVQALDIVAALLDIYPFTTLYIADLNAIQKLSTLAHHHYSVIASIRHCYPHLELWVDAGISTQAELDMWQKLNVRLIIGSENFTNIDCFNSLNILNQESFLKDSFNQDFVKKESVIKGALNKDLILSLDFMPDGYRGPLELLNDTRYWPQNVIVMALKKVGTNSGMDIALTQKIIARAKGSDVIAAGGIRDVNDLFLLKKQGAKAALLATALHQKQISAEQLHILAA